MAHVIVRCDYCGYEHAIETDGASKFEKIAAHCGVCQCDRKHTVVAIRKETSAPVAPYVVWQKDFELRIVRVQEDKNTYFVCEKTVEDAMGNKGWQKIDTIYDPEGSHTDGAGWIIWNLLMSLPPLYPDQEVA